MATPKIDNSTKIEQSGFGISFKSANPAEYPIAYQDDLWDVVDKTSNLAKVLNTQSDGQYDQHSINEELSKGIVDSVKLADLEEGITVGDIEARSILIDGTPPSLEGHKHTVSDITDLPDQLISIEHADLLAKVNNSELVPGQKYRITDYIASTTQINTSSAGKPFDIIVVADDTNSLNENARAVEREGVTYFSTNGADPSKWALKYCIVNDTNRFPWASSTGKGVIYYMKDEWNNECPYDFKGILFTINNEAKYTFDAGGYSASDASLAGFTNNVYSNVISTYITGNKPHLNAIVFEGTNCHSNVFGPNCHSNVIGANCNCNTFEQECNNIVFDAKCRYIKVGSGNEYIHLNPTGQLGQNDYYQNVELKMGLHRGGSQPTMKTITDAEKNQVFLTVYQPKDTQVVSLDLQ